MKKRKLYDARCPACAGLMYLVMRCGRVSVRGCIQKFPD
jgi:hypothetical protein